MKQIYKRLKAETPLFFKRLIAFGASLAAAGVGISQIPNIPAGLLYYSGQAVWVGTVIAIVAKMAVTNPEDIQ